MPHAVYDNPEEKLKRYKSRVNWALRAQKNWQDKVDQWLTYYRNQPKVYTRGGQRVVVPLAVSAIDAKFASLTAVEVDIALSPLGFTSREQSRVAEQALRNEWQRAKVVQRTEPAVKDSLIASIGWAKVWYEYEEQEVEESAGTTVDPDTGEEVELTEQATQVLRDRVVVDYIPWDDMFWDPEAKKFEDIKWIAQRMELPLEQVKEDDRYQNTSDLGANSTINPDWRDRDGDVEEDEERVILWEVYDLETGTACTISLDHDKLLREVPTPYSMFLDVEDRIPFVPLVLRSDPGQVTGISDMQVMRHTLDEINVLRSSLATWVERSKPKMAAREGAFTEAGKRAMRSQEWGEVVELTPNTDVKDLQPINPPSIPSEAFAQDARAEDNLREGIGLNELLQGQLPQGRKTATGMHILADASTIRQSESRNRMERFYEAIARKMLFLMQVFYDQPRITRMVEREQNVVWEWDAEDISTEMSVDVHIEAKEQRTHQMRREDALAVINILGAHPLVNQDALIQWACEELGMSQEIIRMLIKTAEQGQAEQQQALQMQAAQAQVEEGIPPDQTSLPGPVPGSALGSL